MRFIPQFLGSTINSLQLAHSLVLLKRINTLIFLSANQRPKITNH